MVGSGFVGTDFIGGWGGVNQWLVKTKEWKYGGGDFGEMGIDVGDFGLKLASKFAYEAFLL